VTANSFANLKEEGKKVDSYLCLLSLPVTLSRIGINKYLSSVERIYIEGALTSNIAATNPACRVLHCARFRSGCNDRGGSAENASAAGAGETHTDEIRARVNGTASEKARRK
jgi:hypothetical protein